LTTMFRFRTVGIEPTVGVGLQRACIWKEATNSLPLLDSAVPLFAVAVEFTPNPSN